MEESYNMAFKILVVGGESVGKTSFICNHIENDIAKDETLKKTNGVETYEEFFQIEDSFIKIQYWDTTGDKKFKSTLNKYFDKTSGAFIIYDITSKQSFELIEDFVFDIRAKTENIPIIIIGNKCDLEGSRKISTNEGKEKAKKLKTSFYETSAKINKNLTEAFLSMILRLYKSQKKKDEDEIL